MRGYSQERLAAKLNITASTYSKVERDITLLSLPRLQRIAQIFGMTLTDLINYKITGEMNKVTDLDSEIEQLNTKLHELEQTVADKYREIEMHRHSVMSALYDAYHDASMQFEERLPFESLDENCWMYLDICGIKTKEEYDQAGFLIGYVHPDNEERAFEEMIDKPNIYMLFEKGLVKDESHFLKLWDNYKAKGRPKFEVTGNRITRLEQPPF